MVRDDGSQFRTMPWGRDGRERCTGTRFVADSMQSGAGSWANARLAIDSLADEPDAALRVRYLVDTGTSFQHAQATHPHPFLSPDGTKTFFNSDATGQPQIWMMEGFEYPVEGLPADA